MAIAIATQGQIKAAYVAGKRLVIASVRAKLGEILESQLVVRYQMTHANAFWATARILLQHLEALEEQGTEEQE